MKAFLSVIIMSLLAFNEFALAECIDSFSNKPADVIVPLNPQLIRHQVFGEGNKETIVLIHGLGGFLETWTTTGVAQGLAERYKVVVYDQRGHGATEPVGTNYDSKVMAADLLALLDYLKIEKANLVGHSMGARTAMRFAHDYPNRTNKVIFEDMHMKSLERVNYIKADLENVEKLKALPENYASQFEAYETLRGPLGEERASQMTQHHMYLCKDQRWRFSGPVFYQSAGLKEDFTQTMKDAKSPMLFIAADPNVLNLFGGKAAVLWGVGIDHIRENKPDAQIAVVPGAGHGVHYDRTADFLKLINDFLASGENP